MTLPIIPGPFSFLQGAGSALGSFGQAIQERQHYQQALAMQQAAFLSHLIGQGVLAPEAVAGPQMSGLMQQAGMQPIQQGQVELSPQVIAGRRYGQEAAQIPVGTTQSQLLAGTPTAAAAQVEQAKGVEAGVTSQALGNLTPEQARIYKQVQSRENAPLLEALTGRKAAVEMIGQDTEETHLRAQNDIWRGVRQLLPRDPEFNRIASFAAVGALPYLDAQIEAAARAQGMNTERIRLATAITNRSASTYDAMLKRWQSGLEEERKRLQGSPSFTEDMNPQEQQAALDNLQKDYQKRFPMPTVRDALGNLLQEYGMDQNEWQGSMRDIMQLQGGQGGGASTPESRFARVLQMWKAGTWTEEDVDASPLTPDQKELVKKTPRVSTGGESNITIRKGYRPTR